MPEVTRWWKDNIGNQDEQSYTKHIIERFDKDDSLVGYVGSVYSPPLQKVTNLQTIYHVVFGHGNEHYATPVIDRKQLEPFD